MDRSKTWEAHAAFCKAVDALQPAWAHLTRQQARKLQALVEELETLRDVMARRAGNEDAKALGGDR